ncbi:MAG: chorismate synthase, partial [Erysipelotrichaceae bacterium]|nr:chorismate synthase [Erysipelotrichaceae bacterium]
ARPSHADYVAYEKYHGANDPRGGGHFSGRLTTGIVAAGSIAMAQLRKKGIAVGSHILQLDTIRDDEFTDYDRDLELLNTKWFAVLNEEAERKMTGRIEQARADRDSVGGILETVITGLPVGVGEPYFDSLESVLSHAVFSIGGVKGIEFGSGFAFATMPGSVANDAMHYENGTVVCDTNHNGGINGGISNGMPVVFRSVFKPTPSIFRPQNTIDYRNHTDTVLNLEGRHDPCIIHRARVVVDSMTAIVLWDLLTGIKGTDWWL